jgi:hypothetical protein
MITYHSKLPKGCGQPSQGDNTGGISRMLSTTKKRGIRSIQGLTGTMLNDFS